MADKTITALTETTSLSGNDVFVIDNAGGNSRKVKASKLRQYAGGGIEAGAVAVPLIANFTWLNQGAATAVDGAGALVITNDNDNEIHGFTEAAPATPFDVYMRVHDVQLSSAGITTALDSSVFLLCRNSTNGRILSFAVGASRVSGDEQNNYIAACFRYTNPTTYSASGFIRYSTAPMPRWLRINVTSTTVTFYVSPNGLDWVQVGSETIATFLTASGGGSLDQVGFGCRSVSDSPLTAFIISYGQTAPS